MSPSSRRRSPDDSPPRRRPTQKGPSPLAIASLLGIVLALGVAGWMSRNRVSGSSGPAETPKETAVNPFADVEKEQAPSRHDGPGGSRILQTNRAPKGLLAEPKWRGAVQIAATAYSLRNEAEDAKAGGNMVKFNAKAVAAREAFGKAIDATTAFEAKIIDLYGENDKQVREVARERNKWFDLRAKYRKVKIGS